MSYPTLETVNATQDVTDLLVYVNTLTNDLAMPLVLLAFFIVVLLANYMAQFRFKSEPRIDTSFAVAGFLTFGLSLLMILKDGLLNWWYVLITFAIAVIGIVWLALGED